MSAQNITIIILGIGVGFLIVFLVKKIVSGKKAAATSNLQDKAKILQAVRAGKEAVEKEPQNAEAHYLLARAFLADKREEQAYKEYRSASRLGITGTAIPETEFREAIAGLYAKFHEEEEALKEYVLLIKLHPENPEYYFRAGKLFSSRNKPDLAEKYLQKATALNPKEGRYRFELGMHLYLVKKIREAGAEFEAALKLNPADGQILLYMGKILKDAKDYGGAVPYLEKAARDQEYKLRALVELGSCYMSLKMVDKALVELDRAVNCITKESDPDALYARYFLAMCFEKTQEFAKAVAQWEKIYAQKKNFRDVGEKLTQYIEYRLPNAEK
jgi:tetratricopeptide (TPR) repeat protein